jgi:hypothetical protein
MHQIQIAMPKKHHNDGMVVIFSATTLARKRNRLQGEFVTVAAV